MPAPGDLPDPGVTSVSPVAPALQADSLLLSHLGRWIICDMTLDTSRQLESESDIRFMEVLDIQKNATQMQLKKGSTPKLKLARLAYLQVIWLNSFPWG